MIILFGLLTVALVLVSVFLILLVLVQLPKKDAGAGMAFGGGAADALFGAGSGNVLTKITKFSTVAFFIIVLMLGSVHDHLSQASLDVSSFESKVKQQQNQAPTMQPAPAPTVPVVTHPAVASTNTMQLLSTPNAPVTPATNH